MLGSIERLQRRGHSGKQKRWVEGDECENEDGRQTEESRQAASRADGLGLE